MRQSKSASGPGSVTRFLTSPRLAGRALLRGLTGLTFAFAALTLAAQEPAAPPEEAAAPAAESRAAPRLPAGFVPPPAERPEVVTIEKPLLTAEEERAMRTEVARIGTVLNNGVLNDESRKLIDRWAQWRLYRMTMPENREKLHDEFRQLMRPLAGAARLNQNAQSAQEFRRYVCQQVADRCVELLDNHLQVRINAVLVLAYLNETESPPRPFVPAANHLLAVVQDPEQPEAVKIPAVVGLRRMCLLAKGAVQLRDQIARALIAELQDSQTHYWYQERLVQALAAIDLPLDVQNRQPIIVQALAKVLVDKERHWQVRSEAARSLGRAPLDAQVQVPLLATEIANLANQMAVEYGKRPRDYYWKMCFFKTYLAFRAENEEEKKLFNNPGLLARQPNNPRVTEAHQHVVKLARHVLQQQEIPGELLQQLSVWLEENQPTNYRIHPAMTEPILPVSRTQEDAEATVAGSR